MKYLYRIVNIILGVLVFVSAVFVHFLRIIIRTGESLDSFFMNLMDNKTDGVGLAEEFSILRFYKLFTGKDDLSFIVDTAKNGGNILWPKEFYPLNVRLIIFAACFILMLAAGLFLIIWSCFSNKHLPMFITGIVGLVLDIVMIFDFKSISTDIYTAKVDVVGYLIDKLLGEGLLASLLGNVVDKVSKGAVELIITMCGLQNAFLFIFIAVIMWSGAFYLVDLGDPKAKEMKEAEKAAKAEKKAQKAAKKAKD